jgi:hypothetical protein
LVAYNLICVQNARRAPRAAPAARLEPALPELAFRRKSAIIAIRRLLARLGVLQPPQSDG